MWLLATSPPFCLVLALSLPILPCHCLPTLQLALLRSRLEAAEAGGVPPTYPVVAEAVRVARRLAAADAREALEAALRPRADWSTAQVGLIGSF